MNNLRDYYERALQEFGSSDDGEMSLNAFKGTRVKKKSIVSQKYLFTISCYSSIKDSFALSEQIQLISNLEDQRENTFLGKWIRR